MSSSQKSAQLEASYRSDIRLLSDLRRNSSLSKTDLRAVDEALHERGIMIGRLHGPWALHRNLLRPAVKRIALRLLGRSRAQRLSAMLKSMVRQLARK